VTALLDQQALLEHADEVGVTDRGQALRDHERRTALQQSGGVSLLPR
jgi:hypothetical protein